MSSDTARAGSIDLSTVETVIFRNAIGCTEFFVSVPATSGDDALVRVDGLHGENDWFQVVKGSSITFRVGTGGIRRVTARCLSFDGTATLLFTVKSMSWGRGAG
jgi:hypothetical protein